MAKLGALLAVALLAAVGVTVVMVTRRESDPRFDTAQKAPVKVLPAAVADAMRKTPETRNGPAGTSAKCSPGAVTQLGNPWQCTINYAAGPPRAYRVIVAADESYFGQAVGSTTVIKGCCVQFGA